MNSANDLFQAEKLIGYTFKDKSFLVTAFTHSSYSNEHRYVANYERQEFLGDSILNFIVGYELFKLFPNIKEGELTKKRASLVSAKRLAKVIDNLDLIRFLKIGSGKNSDEILKSDNVKCDLFEAILGGIALDSNMDMGLLKEFVWSQIGKFVNETEKDYKSKVFEYCAKNHLNHSFDVKKDIETNQFIISLYINDKFYSKGIGRNKLEAENIACSFFYKDFIQNL